MMRRIILSTMLAVTLGGMPIAGTTAAAGAALLVGQPLEITGSVAPDPVHPGDSVTYQLQVHNPNDAPAAGVTLTSELASSPTYVAGSGTCDATYSPTTRVVTQSPGTIPAGGSAVCSFGASVPEGPWDGVVLEDGFELGLGGWRTTHTGRDDVPDWRRAGIGPHSGLFSAHLAGAETPAEQLLTTPPIPLGAAPLLEFQHRWDFERAMATNYDGGVIEYSVDDGTSWSDLSSLGSVGYTGTITTGSDNPLGGRQGYTGLRATWTAVSLPLPQLANQTVRFRFRSGADAAVASTGWWVDDFSVTDEVPAGLAVTATATDLPEAFLDLTVPVVPEPPEAPTALQAVATSPTSVALSFTPSTGTDSRPVVGHQATCRPQESGTSPTGTTRQSEIELQGLTAGVGYRCSVRAWTTAGFGPAVTVTAPTVAPGTASAPSATRAPATWLGPLPDSMTARQRAVLRSTIRPGTTPQMQTDFGVPTTLWVRDPGTAAPPSRPGQRPEVAAARGYVAAVADLYRLRARDVVDARTVGVHDLGDGPVVVQLGQDVRGVEVWGERLNVVMDEDLGLVGLTGYLLPRHVLDDAVRLSSSQAVAAAYADLTGRSMPAGAVGRPVRSHGYDVFHSRSLLDPTRAKPVMFRLTGGLVSAYYVEVGTDRRGEQLRRGFVVDAKDGRVLARLDLVADENADYQYRAWADPTAGNQPFDGPQGSAGSPHPTGVPDGFHPPYLPPNLVHGPLTGDPWLPAGATTTTGNNVDAYADTADPDGFRPGTSDLRATVTSPGVFDRSYDTTQPPSASTDQVQAGVTQLFYDVNWLHDWFYDSGFDEAAGNAQVSNYGRGGAGSDPVLAEDQDSSGRDNANMFTPADGASPRMQMFVWSGPVVTGVEASPGGPMTAGAAGYGPASFDVTAELTVANDGTGTPSDACEPLTGTVTGRIVLADRGTCTFITKTMNAQAAGAVGLLIANNTTGLPTLGGCTLGTTQCSAITIGTLGISQADGASLKQALSSGPVSTRMFRQPQPDRDGALDGTVVAHEWGHYLSNRLVPGMSGTQAAAMGEGWSDFVALLQTVQPEDVTDLDGAFATGVYASGALAYPDDYYFGIRRVPYSIDFAKDGFTFRHIAAGEPLPAVPTRVVAADNTEPHNAGEIWATMLWECYAALLGDTTGASPRLTFDEARRRMTDYLVASLRMTAPNPTYLEARDALLLAAAADDPADFELFAAAFARRGAGSHAIGPSRDSTSLSGIVESYEVDTSPPTTTISVTGGTAGSAGWYVASPVVAVSAAGPAPGAPELRCVLDDPTHATFDQLPSDERDPCDRAAPGAGMPDGVHTLYAASRDLLERTSPVSTRTVKVDTKAPDLSCRETVLFLGQLDAMVRADVADAASGAVSPTVAAAADTSSAGTRSVELTAADVAGNSAAVTCDYTVIVDDEKPTKPQLASLPHFTRAATVTLTFGSTDGAGSGVAHYRIQVRQATYRATKLPTSWSDLAGGEAVGEQTFRVGSLARGSTYCFRVIAEDFAGNASAPSAQACTARLLDDPALKLSKGWRKVTSSAYYGSSARQTSRTGRTASLLDFHGSRLAVLATTCRTCGSVKVYVGTTLVKKLSLKSTRTKRSRVLEIPLPSRMAGTVRVRTVTSRAVTVDGLGASHG